MARADSAGDVPDAGASRRASDGPVRRARGTRADTENELLDAAQRLLERDGVLAGITLREVASEARVNHGQIYQYFGTRQNLLRAALARVIDRDRPNLERHWSLPFAARRRWMWRSALGHRDFVRLQALLALDGDPEFTLFPFLSRTREALERDVADGDLPDTADLDVLHAMTAVTYLGYGIFREVIARDLGVSLRELDRRAAVVFEDMLAGVQRGRQN